MKLLLDQNLSHRLVQPLLPSFPESSHVRSMGLERSDDQIIWEFARQNGFAMVSNDDDFRQLSFLFGHPPKLVWLGLGNATTDEVLMALRRRTQDVLDFGADPDSSILVIS